MHLTGDSIGAFLEQHPVAVIDVWAPWCGPCRAFAPVFAAAARAWGTEVGFGKVHADREHELVARWGVRSIPSLLVFRDAALVRHESGVMPLRRLEALLRKAGARLPEGP